MFISRGGTGERKRYRSHRYEVIGFREVLGRVLHCIHESREGVGCIGNMIAQRIDDAREEIAGEVRSPK